MYSSPKVYTRTSRSGTLNGVPCTYVSGCHMCTSIQPATTPATLWDFVDNNAFRSKLLYLNPRICCQNFNYATPSLQCPINFVGSAYRKFCFTKLAFHYAPLTGSTATTTSICFAFAPEPITGGSNNVPLFASFQASAYGPSWAPLTVDCTKFLDKSKWYACENNVNAIAGSDDAELYSVLQGTFMVAGDSTGLATTVLQGLIFMEYEIALYEMGPQEIGTHPAFTTPLRNKKIEQLQSESSSSNSADESKTNQPGAAASPPMEFVVVPSSTGKCEVV